ncbi:13101_t:CDS:10 [Ambispora leptoticha]|uniref:13101_t:CDS:1 n=1 Tax=Ambispora leptoticha TaxID=144679 RepID=A0A9N9FX28_9GLOM|nr:13101_t:CDS:10 [Ambispora leptoticha]
MTNEQDKDRKFRENAKKLYEATASIGLKSAGKTALNFGVDTATNLMTEPKKALHTGLGLMERGLNAIPLVGGFFSFLTGTAKDALTDQKFEEIANQIQGVKEGLNSLADAVGEAIDGLRGEMQEALEAMGARQDQLEQFTKAFKEEQDKDFEKYKHQINEKTAKTEQAFEDLQADYTRHNKILETQIKDNEEQLSEFQENLANVESEQKKLNLEHQELAETLEEQVNLAYQQKQRLDFVVNEIEEIEEQFNQRITTRKVDEIAEKLEKHNQKIDKLSEQIDHNKNDVEANLTKIQKTLELKAEEAQLLASEHETAPLTDPEKRKPEEAAPSQQKQQQQEQTEQSAEPPKSLQEVIENTKSQLLEQLQEVQEQVHQNITPLEKTTAPQEDSESESEEEEIKELEQKEKQLISEKTQAQTKLIQARNQQQATQQQKAQIQAEIIKEQKQIQKIEQSLEVKKTEEQILEDNPETPTLKKIEEKIQEIKESQSSTAAPQKSMSLYMLYLIIFLLEYIVIETKKEELVQAQEEFAEETVQKETEYIERLQEAEQTLEKVKERTKNLKTVNFSVLSQGVGTAGNIFFTNQEEDYLTSPVAQEFLRLTQASGIPLNPEEQALVEKIQTKQNEQVYQEISQTLAKIPAYPPEIKKILSKLLTNLKEEQILALAAQSLYLRNNPELEKIYSFLTNEQKLTMLNSGLDNLQINTTEKKKELLNIRMACREEERAFDLSIKEKENILRLITNKISGEQLKTYEEYGVPIYNAATEDLITIDQPAELINSGRDNLEKFPLSSHQEQIIKTLAPLQREYNYSEELLSKLRTLPSRQFLTQQEIIPLEYQKTKDPYKELKKAVLGKKYKLVREEFRHQAKEEIIKQKQAIRSSFLPALLFFAQLNPTDLANQEYRLSKEVFGEEKD